MSKENALRKETIMFCASVFFAMAAVGIQGTVGIFVFGFLWLVIGD